MAIDWEKPIQTNDGRAAKLLVTFSPPLTGDVTRGVVVTNRGGDTVFIVRKEDGTFGPVNGFGVNGTSIVNVPEVAERRLEPPVDLNDLGNWVAAMLTEGEYAYRTMERKAADDAEKLKWRNVAAGMRLARQKLKDRFGYWAKPSDEQQAAARVPLEEMPLHSTAAQAVDFVTKFVADAYRAPTNSAVADF